MSQFFVDSSALVKRYVTELATGLPRLALLSADRDLLNAALAEGLPADDPNAHP